MRLATFHVDVDLAEAHRVSLGSPPIHVLPERPAPEKVLQFLLAGLLPLNGHVALLNEPGIEVHRLPERVESVVRDNEDRRRWVEPRDHLAHEVVALAIDALDRIAEFCGQRFVVHRV